MSGSLLVECAVAHALSWLVNPGLSAMVSKLCTRMTLTSSDFHPGPRLKIPG